MLILILVALTAGGIVIGCGAVIGLFAIALAAVLIALGVVSSSIAVGLFSKRVSYGLRAFLLQCTVISSIVAGMGCGLLIQAFFFEGVSFTQAILCGALGGMAAGSIIAALIDFILRHLNSRAQEVLKPSNHPG